MSDNLVKRLREWWIVYPEDEDKDVGHLYEEAADRIEELEAEIETLTTAGIVEVAARNPNVLEYMKHWEGRAEAAEAEVIDIFQQYVDANEARIDLEATLKKLEYWFDADQEVLDAMTTDERADHMRQLKRIREALNK